MLVLTFVFFGPFLKNYSQAYNGFHQSDQTTDLSDYLSHFGILLFLVSGLLVFALYRTIGHSRTFRSMFSHRGKRDSLEVAAATAALGVLALVVIFLASSQRWGVTALSFVGLVAVVIVACREMRSHARTAPIMLFVYGMLALGPALPDGFNVL